MRWWDGATWTEHTQQPAAAAYASAAPAYASAGTAYGPAAPAYAPAYAPANLSFAHRNSLSLIAIGVVAVYILLAVSTHVVLLGIFPILMSVRATKRREALGPVAVIAALIAVGVAIIALT